MRIPVFLIALLIISCRENRQIPEAVQPNADQQNSAQRLEPEESKDRHDFGPSQESAGKRKLDIATEKPKQGAATRLYTDAEVEKLAGNQLDTLKKKGTLLLDVVPDGESDPRSEVFKKMGIDESRLVKGEPLPFNMVIFLTWQASPSYDLSFMTAINDPANEKLSLLDPKRKVYGVSIDKHEQ
jgi:hypothetical protein